MLLLLEASTLWYLVCSSSFTHSHGLKFILIASSFQTEPTTSVAFTRLGVLGAEGQCRAFDEAGKGYVRSEGCGVVLLKRLSQALQDHDHIYCLIRGSALGRSAHASCTFSFFSTLRDVVIFICFF